MKPYVICHMCTTIDGKILVDGWGADATPLQDRNERVGRILD